MLKNAGAMRPLLRTTSLFAIVSGILILIALATPTPVAAQATVGTGSIQGTIVDPQGGAVSGAKITVTSKATGQVFPTSTNATGAFNVAALIPGEYLVRVEAKGFKTAETLARAALSVVSTSGRAATRRHGSESCSGRECAHALPRSLRARNPHASRVRRAEGRAPLSTAKRLHGAQAVPARRTSDARGRRSRAGSSLASLASVPLVTHREKSREPQAATRVRGAYSSP